MRVAVDGSTGYLGNHVVAALRKENIDVRCIVHGGAREKDKQFLQSLGADVVVASLETAGQDLAAALTGCDVVIHLIGSIAPKKGQSLEDLHSAQTANLVTIAKSVSVKKLIQVTALGTEKDAISSYHQTKWLAEQHVKNSGIPYLIYRPSLIIGKRVGHRDSKLVARYMELVRTRPRVPVIGGGENKIQPIFVEDLASAIVRGVVTDEFNNGVYELGGPEVLKMREFVERLIRLQGVDKKVTPIPPFAASLLAAACETFQSVPLVSRDQVKLSSQDNVCSNNALSTTFGVTPTSIDHALDTYRSTPGDVGADSSPARESNAPKTGTIK